MNMYNSFATIAKAHPNSIAVVEGDSTYSYADMLKAVEGLAAVLASSTQKEAVGVFLPTCYAFIVAHYACMRAGYGMLPFNLLAPAKDVLFAASDSGIDTVVTCEALLPKLKDSPLKLIVVEELAKQAASGAVPPMEQLGARQAASGDDLALLLYTSGTTGDPKGVRLTHGNLMTNINDMLAVVDVNEQDCIIGILPLFHIFALTGTMGLAMHSGARFIAHAGFNPDATLRSIEQHKVSILLAVPSMFRVLVALQRAKGYDVSSLRIAVAGGEPLPPQLEQDFKEVFGIDLLQGYGMTETSPIISVNRPGRNRSGTAGEILPQVEARVVDEAGKDLPHGEVGELWVKGPSVMQGYHNQPEETAKVMTDGWLATGDMVQLAADGYLTITGRKKEMIIVGGMNVFPAEVEGVVDKHPGVMMVAVLGEQDEKRGESVKAVVVPKDPRLLGTPEALEFATKMAQAASIPGAAGAAGGQAEQAMPWADLAALEQDLKQYCNEHLAQYKRPRSYEFRGSLPLGPTGKVTKKLL